MTSYHPVHTDMSVQQHNAVFRVLYQQHQQQEQHDPSLPFVPPDPPVPAIPAQPAPSSTPSTPSAPTPFASRVAPGEPEIGCHIADTQQGNHKFVCTSFPNMHAFESATVLLQISVLRNGDVSVRTRMRIMRSVNGDVFQNVPALCGPVYHIDGSRHDSKESSKELVLPHAIISMFCIYVLLMTKLRAEAVKRDILPPTYPGHQFDKLSLGKRADKVFEAHPLPDLEPGVSVFNEEQFDFIKPVNAAFAQLNNAWDYKPQLGGPRKRAALDLAATSVQKVARECVNE